MTDSDNNKTSGIEGVVSKDNAHQPDIEAAFFALRERFMAGEIPYFEMTLSQLLAASGVALHDR